MASSEELNKARETIRRVRAGRRGQVQGRGRTRVRQLGIEDEIEGLGPVAQEQAATSGSGRRLVSAMRTPSPNASSSTPAAPGVALPAPEEVQWGRLDRGRLTARRVVAAVGWETGQKLRVQHEAKGVWSLHATAAARGVVGSVDETARLALIAQFVRRTRIDTWPGVLIVAAGASVWIVDIRRSIFEMPNGRSRAK